MAHPTGDTRNRLFTVLGTPRQLRAGDSVTRPVSLLFTDEVLDQVAELKMTSAHARELAAALVKAADASEC